MKKIFALLSLLLIALMFGWKAEAANSAAQKNPLAKTAWSIESYGAADDQQSVRSTSKQDSDFPSIRFTNQSSGYIVGCNSISFSYTVQKRKFNARMKITTAKACAGEIMKQDQEIISALEKSGSFKITGDNLEIYYDNGKVMRLVRLAR